MFNMIHTLFLSQSFPVFVHVVTLIYRCITPIISQLFSTHKWVDAEVCFPCTYTLSTLTNHLYLDPIFRTQQEVNLKTGALNIKEGESSMNTVTPVVTYLLWCSTDITSLLSGMATKAVIAYVSDYISKTSLKTHVVFDTIWSIFDKNSEMIGVSLYRKEKARHIMTKIVNSLTSKLERGAPIWGTPLDKIKNNSKATEKREFRN